MCGAIFILPSVLPTHFWKITPWKTIEYFKWNEDYEENLRRAKRYVYEVRALRAFYFFELCKRYGDIPLLTRTYTIGGNQLCREGEICGCD